VTIINQQSNGSTATTLEKIKPEEPDMSPRHSLHQTSKIKESDETDSILREAPIGFFKSNSGGKYIFVNPALAKMY
jgi:PAS domain-containing protein